jgi:transposase
VVHGWLNDLWTGSRVAVLIERHFGVQFHPQRVCGILHERLKWSSQRPQRPRPGGDDAAAEQWVQDEFPPILAAAQRRRARLAFVDETGFLLSPHVRRTFAPRGETPVCRVGDPHARISAIAAITVTPRGRRVGLVYNLLGDNANFRGPGIAYFLGLLRAAVGGPLTLLWDRITIHSCEAVRRCLAGLPDVVAESFPPYAPELNPVDGIWGYIKYSRLANYAPPDLEELRGTVTGELDRLRGEEDLLRSFVRRTKLPVGV